MRKGVTSKPKSYRINRGKMTKAQKSTKANNPRYISNHKSGLTPKQLYKLEKMNLKNERLGLNAKRDTIMSIGHAFAENLAPSAASAGFAIGDNISSKANKNQPNINNLINGGSNQAGTSNDEEINEAMPGGNSVR